MSAASSSPGSPPTAVRALLSSSGTPCSAAVVSTQRKNWRAEPASSVPEVDVTHSPYKERLAHRMGPVSRPVIAKIARHWYTFSDMHQVSKNVVYNPGPGDATYGMSWEDRTSVTRAVNGSTIWLRHEMAGHR